MNDAHSLGDRQPRWHLLGAGSLGCLFAAYLQRAGIAIELIVRDDATQQQLRANGGITLHSGDANATIAIAAATTVSVEAPIRRLLICTKAQQTLAAVAAIQNKLASDAVIVLLQNGMGVREQLQPVLPGASILHALSTEGAFRTQRFHVTHAGRGETLLGAIDAGPQALAERVAHEWQCCALNIAFAPDIERRLWLKLAVNSVINPLTALQRCRNGELLQRDAIAALIAELCSELEAIAHAEHIDLSAAQMREEIYRVMRATAQNKSSMLQDVEAKRSTEIDFINGFIVQRAQMHQLPCAHHERLLRAMKALQP